MLRQIGRNRPGFLGGVLAYLTFAVGLLAAPPEWLSILRENSFDAVLLADFELRRTTPDRARNAEELKLILGGLKGPLMKVAQILATIPDPCHL